MFANVILAVADSQRHLVVDLLAILATAALVAMVLSRLRFAAIPAYIITGALIGPYALGMVQDPENIAAISELAILLLMFTIGLHLHFTGVGLEAVKVTALGVGSTLVSMAILWPLSLTLGLSAPAALAAAMALSMSSTAVVLRILQQRREMTSAHGRICVAVSIAQDLISLVILASLPLLASWAGTETADAGAIAPDAASEFSKSMDLFVRAARGIGGILAMILLGRLIIPWLLRQAARDVSSETLLVLSAAIALGAAVGAGVLGFSPELGAFLAGFLLAGTDFKHQLTGQLSPMRDLFMAVFFTAVGLKLDLHALGDSWWIVALALPVLLAVKASVIGFSTWLIGSTTPNAFFVGCLLCQAGEFSLVILGAASDPETVNLIPEEQSGILTAIVVLALIVTPGIADLGRRWKEKFTHVPAAQWLTQRSLRELPVKSASTEPAESVAAETGQNTDPAQMHRHVIIAGFGVVGRNLAEHFGAAGIPFVVIELNPETVRRQRKLGRAIVFGDVANPEVLESANLHGAEAIVLTIPDDDGTLRACRSIRSLSPTVFIAARTSFLSRANQATELGVNQVTIEEVATARDMASQVMRMLTKKGLGKNQAEDAAGDDAAR